MSKNLYEHNSFAENLRKILSDEANALSFLTATQRAMTENDTFTTFDYIDANGEKTVMQLPTYTALIQKVEGIQRSFDALSEGTGHVTTTDGSNRRIKISNLPKTPRTITSFGGTSIDTFSIDSTWFFEDFMFPRLKVNVDLTGLVEDSADRVHIKRIIIDTRAQGANEFWSLINGNNYSYLQIITLLNSRKIKYAEDEQDVDFPLVYNEFVGEFNVVKDPEYIRQLDGKTSRIVYTLDTVNYTHVSSNGATLSTYSTLAQGDILTFDNCKFQVDNVDVNSKKITLTPILGSTTPGKGSTFVFYQDPFRKKVASIGICANEYDILYMRPINEEFNLLSNEWSVPLMFATNDLVNENDQTQYLIDFYHQSVEDWGSNLIAEAKERGIKAYNGKIPNKPTLFAENFKVVQINEHVSAATDEAEIRSLSNDIKSTKSRIDSLQTTISSQQTRLASLTNLTEYQKMNTTINQNITIVKSLESQYSSMVNKMKSILKENDINYYTPAYRVRGFFDIPEVQYSDAQKTRPQQIIGFEIMYRYLKSDNSNIELKSYQYKSADGQSTMTGVFTDWNIKTSKIRERYYNQGTGMYEWNDESSTDATQININQIDLPINYGENIEIKVRSLSEAGYPENTLKSEWSEPIKVAFPKNVSNVNSIDSYKESIENENINLIAKRLIESYGFDAHMEDTLKNSNSITGVAFKHSAKNVAFENKDINNNTVETVSVQDIISAMLERIQSNETTLTENARIYEEMQNSIQALQSLKSAASMLNTFDQTITNFRSQITAIASTIQQQKNIQNTNVNALDNAIGNINAAAQGLKETTNSIGNNITNSVSTAINSNMSDMTKKLETIGKDASAAKNNTNELSSSLAKLATAKALSSLSTSLNTLASSLYGSSGNGGSMKTLSDLKTSLYGSSGNGDIQSITSYVKSAASDASTTKNNTSNISGIKETLDNVSKAIGTSTGDKTGLYKAIKDVSTAVNSINVSPSVDMTSFNNGLTSINNKLTSITSVLGSGRSSGDGKNESLTTTITSIYSNITTNLATSTQVTDISNKIGAYTSSDTLKNAITCIDNELGDGDDKVKDMISNLQNQITALQNALSTPAVFTYSGLDEVNNETIVDYFKGQLNLYLSDGTQIKATSVNTFNKTVVYMLPNGKSLGTTSDVNEKFNDVKYNGNINTSNMTITFTKQG